MTFLNKTRIRRALAVIGIGLAIVYLLLMQTAFVNHSQEFGAYGMYNRTLRVIRSMDEYTVVQYRVHRKLELSHLFHVEEFSFVLRDKNGHSAKILFKKGADDMSLRDDAALAALIKAKYVDALSRSGDESMANQALVATPTSVTAPAGQEPRQP